MRELSELALKLDALGHPVRLRIAAELYRDGPLYLSDIAKKVGISRALAKVHLVKMQRAGLVRTRVELLPERAQALRYYELVDFDIRISPDTLAKLVEGEEGGGEDGGEGRT